MREEVEALLTADADNEDFLSSPAYEFAAEIIVAEPSEFLAGEKIGRFEIQCLLGTGGMGQIYLAHDESLGRKIALKLISREFAADPHRVHRFELEARAASALNHPNVCVIHDVGETETGRHFIAMEHIQGITLRDQLARGTFKPLEALQVTLQVGAALASAHAVGIVHRDIKPENIMLRPDGYIKVVDFGLAKLAELLPEQRRFGNTLVLTEPQMLMGTVKYMSPEQLREGPVDERTDIWSLGIVLYEMLTGSTPFEARSRNDSIALILAAERAELVFPDEVPPELRQIVKKALEKDCDKRYQTVLKLTADLAGLKKELEHNADGYSPGIPPIQPSPEPFGGSRIFTRLKSQALSTADSIFNEIKIHKTATAIFAGASGVLAVLLFLPVAARWVNDLFTPSKPPPQVEKITPQTLTMKKLTNTRTSVVAAISPDGQLVAYVDEQNGKQRLMVMGTSTPDSSVAVPPEENVKYLGITFSRDGQYIYFTRKENDDPGNLYRLAWSGNTPVQIKKHVDSPISLSPQGERFAFVRYDRGTEYSLILSNIDGSNEEVLATRKDGDTLSVYGLAWSPDGSKVVCPESRWKSKFQTNLLAFDVNDKHEEVIGGSEWFHIKQVAWNDMNSLVVSAREYGGSPYRLFRIPLPQGKPQKITTDLDEYQGVSISGENIVTIKTNLSWQLWISTPGDLQQTRPITGGESLYYGLTWTSRGKIVYSSIVQDRLNISRINPDGSDLTPLTRDAGDNFTPAASADGRFIVFSSDRNGPFNIWRMNADDGSNPVQLTFTDGNFYPSWSPDNKWVAFDNQIDTKMSAWKVSLQSGETVKLSEGYRMPVFSPDSQLVACRYVQNSDTKNVAIFPAHGGSELRHFKVPKQEWQWVRWFEDSRQMTYVKNENGYSNIWSYNLDTGVEKQLTNFNSDQIYAYAWSPDYKQVACQRGVRISDVTIISER
ncbi:MAG TPA: protein kinase [Pyrinomonadaceae bacterium]|nr:protein kinase [Pyrinomonadaceae bacterium]